ncbi:hypothetical protein [Natrarchaeobius chitinivorans]|uniref:hypothetical protein n=1 Tax=Natrarchaeobius chitinivorans TaxID=1679083 RepID=UPI0014053AF3|nr:hypothetical protein [Natrarchaeobius chitinivorans]
MSPIGKKRPGERAGTLDGQPGETRADGSDLEVDHTTRDAGEKSGLEAVRTRDGPEGR